MRVLAYLALVTAAVIAFARGELRLGLALACFKAMLVGLFYMELTHAHPAHRAGFIVGGVFLTTVLVLVA